MSSIKIIIFVVKWFIIIFFTFNVIYVNYVLGPRLCKTVTHPVSYSTPLLVSFFFCSNFFWILVGITTRLAVQNNVCILHDYVWVLIIVITPVVYLYIGMNFQKIFKISHFVSVCTTVCGLLYVPRTLTPVLAAHACVIIENNFSGLQACAVETITICSF